MGLFGFSQNMIIELRNSAIQLVVNIPRSLLGDCRWRRRLR
jgi:hypothetical protein